MAVSIARRKQAYQFIVDKIRKLETEFSHKIDRRIEDTDIISLAELNKLKRGIADPPAELITALKKLLHPVASEDEIEDNLVKPFLPKLRSPR